MSESPVSILKEARSFPDIIKELLNGKKIHKLEWKDKKFYGFMKEGKLTLHKPDNNDYDWILNDGDLSGSDYIII